MRGPNRVRRGQIPHVCIHQDSAKSRPNASALDKNPDGSITQQSVQWPHPLADEAKSWRKFGAVMADIFAHLQIASVRIPKCFAHVRRGKINCAHGATGSLIPVKEPRDALELRLTLR
jgi:hypothetical protein